MAIYSLHHSFIGRSTHAPGAACVHVRYITRSEACTVILGERMPLDGRVYAWLNEQETSDRKNARVVDRLTVALPSELTREQNIELLQNFGERMTQGRAPWLAAIHDGPGDADNPHAHVVFRDRDIETGRRVMLTTEPGSTERFRQGWEEEANLALERAGMEARIDRRSLADQGIDREPEIHVGQAAWRLAERGQEFESNAIQVTRRIHGTPGEVTINYPEIDQGLSRAEENEARKLRNWVRAQEEIAMNGPVRPEDLPPMDRIALMNTRLDARYREAFRTGEAPADDGDPATIAIREQLAERDRARPGQDVSYVPITYGESLLPALPGHTSAADPSAESRDDIKRRKEEYEKLKEEPGMERVLRARDHLNAVTFERGEPAPTEEDLKAYLVWSEINRLPVERENSRPQGRGRSDQEFNSEAFEPGEKAPKRDVIDLIGGGGMAAVGKIAESLETLFDDNRSAQQIEKDEKIMGEKRTVEQITEQQQRQQQAEEEKWRMHELQLYLDQRDRERHHDRGR
jgi:hypothetical protein